MKFEGIVEAISNKQNNTWAIKVGEEWYNSDNPTGSPYKGDRVYGEYKEKGKFKIIQTITTTQTPTNRNIRIERQACLKAATNLISGIAVRGVRITSACQATLDLADKFMKYVETGEH